MAETNTTTAGSGNVEGKNQFTLNDAARQPEFNLMIQINFWWYVTVIPVGILGNLLCLLVVTRKQNRSISCSVYMAALSVADTVVLLSQGSILLVSRVLANVLSEAQLNVVCQTCAYSLYSAAFGDVLIILALLLERVVVVTWPFKAAVYCSPRRALIVIAAIVVITLLYNVPVFMSTSFVVQCVTVPSAGLFYPIYQMSKIVLCGVVPFVGILTMNVMILWAVRSHRKKTTLTREISIISSSVEQQNTAERQSDGQATDPKVEDIKLELDTKRKHCMRKRERQMTLMMVVMSLAFLCLTIPKYYHQLAFTNIDWNRSREMRLVFGWSGMITQSLYILNSAVNLFLYVMSGSKFRTDLINLFRCK